MMAAKLTLVPISSRKTAPERRIWAAPERRVPILSVGGSAQDHNHLCRIFSGPPWHISSVSGCLEAIAHLTWHRVPVILCERRLPDGSWRDILGYAAQYAVAPVLIVAAPSADDRLLAEVSDYGGFGVLCKPFRCRELRRAVASAWRQSVSAIPGCAAGAASTVTEMPHDGSRLRATVRFMPFPAN